MTLIIVGKATPNQVTGEVELWLTDFRKMLQSQGKFVYPWSFNPDYSAITHLQNHINAQSDVFLCLPIDGGYTKIKMHIADFRHNNSGIPTCPPQWNQYCIPPFITNIGAQTWIRNKAKIWFLIDAIDDLNPPLHILSTFSPVFPNKYKKWGRRHFAFLAKNIARKFHSL